MCNELACLWVTSMFRGDHTADAERAENESYGGKGCLGILVAVLIGLAIWAVGILLAAIWLGTLAGWW